MSTPNMGGGPEISYLPPHVSNNSSWMKQLPQHLHNVPLNKLAIPGSHDSFTFFLDKTGPIAPSESSILVELAKILGDRMKDVVYQWSVTQSLNVTQQLEAGIRYFDIRVCTRQGTGDLYVVHGLYGMPVRPLLEEIRGFLDHHSSEIVILDFKQLFCMTPEEHQRFLGIIVEVFRDKLCPCLDTASVTLDTLWENGLQVLAFYHDDIVKEHLEFWPGDIMVSPWPNVTSVQQLLDILQQGYDDPPPDEAFCVTQGVLTPTVPFILENMFSSLKERLAEQVAPPMVDWLKVKHPRGRGTKGINICILDFVEMAQYITTVIQLNHKITK